MNNFRSFKVIVEMECIDSAKIWGIVSRRKCTEKKEDKVGRKINNDES